MANPHRTYEIRCPIHGFISFNDWERGVISAAAFQRLRRIRQLAWTDYVYPGAMHTRFEHSLGVMHTATLLYDSITRNSTAVLTSDLAYNDAGLQRDRQLVRFAALLHDVAGYDVLSFDPTGRERLLEVKTTNGSARTPFFLSRNECQLAVERPGDWCVYRVHLFAQGPLIFRSLRLLNKRCVWRPSHGRAYF